MAAQSYIKPTMLFADGTKKELEIGPLAPTAPAITNAKSNIASINANASTIADYYLSTGGASFVSISAAHIVTTERTDFNLYNQGGGE